MRRRYAIPLALVGAGVAGLAAATGYIEVDCRAPVPGYAPAAPYTPLAGGGRPEARTFLTYPEWHIVYSAESLGRWLAAGRPPSGYAYGSDIAGFWRGFCAINRVSRGQPGAGEAKVMIYTIGLSFTAELAIKAAYERTIGRLSEWLGGWHSVDDRYAAHVQQRYARFMHEVPWYRFPFFAALKGEWRTGGSGVRHVERRFALSSEYLVKGVYAKAIGAADSAAMDADERAMRIVVRASPAALRRIDVRLKAVGSVRGGLTVVEVPRYAQFTELAQKLAMAKVPVVEIAGNDDIFATLLLPDDERPAGMVLLDMPIERVGWHRVGTAVKVPALGALLRWTRAAGGTVEHVYDY